MQNIGSLKLNDGQAKDQVIQVFESAGTQIDQANKYEQFRNRNRYSRDQYANETTEFVDQNDKEEEKPEVSKT